MAVSATIVVVYVLVLSSVLTLSFKMHVVRCATNNFKMMALDRPGKHDRFIPPILQKKLKEGSLSVRDIDQMFRLDKQDMLYIDSFASSGYAGVIISLDTVLVDLSVVMHYAYTLVGNQLNQNSPSVIQVRDIVGCKLKDGVSALAWTIPMQLLPTIQNQFYDVVGKLIDNMEILPQPDIISMLAKLINEKNDICITTSLPREVALKVLRRTGMSKVFEGRIDPSQLVTNDDFDEFLDKGKITIPMDGEKWKLVRCLSYMKVPSSLCVYMDGNRRNLLEAKRLGLGTIALKGYSRDPSALGVGDKIISVDQLTEIRTLDFYNIIRRSIANREGPAIQKQTTPDVPKKVKTITEAPTIDDDRERDTFADEYGSDQS